MYANVCRNFPEKSLIGILSLPVSKRTVTWQKRGDWRGSTAIRGEDREWVGQVEDKHSSITDTIINNVADRIRLSLKNAYFSFTWAILLHPMPLSPFPLLFPISTLFAKHHKQLSQLMLASD